MNYKEEIGKRMVSEEMLIQAEQIFLHYAVKNMGAQGKPLDLFQISENKEALAVVRALQLAGTIFLEILSYDMEPLENLDKFVEKMDDCKSTLSACMNATRGKIAKMR